MDSFIGKYETNKPMLNSNNIPGLLLFFALCALPEVVGGGGGVGGGGVRWKEA